MYIYIGFCLKYSLYADCYDPGLEFSTNEAINVRQKPKFIQTLKGIQFPYLAIIFQVLLHRNKTLKGILLCFSCASHNRLLKVCMVSCTVLCYKCEIKFTFVYYTIT